MVSHMVPNDTGHRCVVVTPATPHCLHTRGCGSLQLGHLVVSHHLEYLKLSFFSPLQTIYRPVGPQSMNPCASDI